MRIRKYPRDFGVTFLLYALDSTHIDRLTSWIACCEKSEMHAKIKKHNKNNKKNSFVRGGDENMTVFGRVRIRKNIPIPTKLRHRFDLSAVNQSDNAGLYLRELSLSDHNQNYWRLP